MVGTESAFGDHDLSRDVVSIVAMSPHADRRPINSPEPWRLVSTPPWSGLDNMAYDRQTLNDVASHHAPATLRFFSWSESTVSFGRLQKADLVAPLIPKGWASVQRPTGGGVVNHHHDLCLSLCWRPGQAPFPKTSTADHYRWIHSVLLSALSFYHLSMAQNAEPTMSETTFHTRRCFTDPVTSDLLDGSTKVVGGAIARHQGAILYQGSLQMTLDPFAVERLKTFFLNALKSV